MNDSRVDREQDKFVESSDGGTSVRVTCLGDLMSGKVFDSVFASYPDGVTEVYTYKLNGVVVSTITVVFSDATKEVLVSVVRGD